MCQIIFFYNPLYEPPDRQKSSVYMPSPVLTAVQTLSFVTHVTLIRIIQMLKELKWRFLSQFKHQLSNMREETSNRIRELHLPNASERRNPHKCLQVSCFPISPYKLSNKISNKTLICI